MLFNINVAYNVEICVSITLSPKLPFLILWEIFTILQALQFISKVQYVVSLLVVQGAVLIPR